MRCWCCWSIMSIFFIFGWGSGSNKTKRKKRIPPDAVLQSWWRRTRTHPLLRRPLSTEHYVHFLLAVFFWMFSPNPLRLKPNQPSQHCCLLACLSFSEFNHRKVSSQLGIKLSLSLSHFISVALSVALFRLIFLEKVQWYQLSSRRNLTSSFTSRAINTHWIALIGLQAAKGSSMSRKVNEEEQTKTAQKLIDQI